MSQRLQSVKVGNGLHTQSDHTDPMIQTKWSVCPYEVKMQQNKKPGGQEDCISTFVKNEFVFQLVSCVALNQMKREKEKRKGQRIVNRNK